MELDTWVFHCPSSSREVRNWDLWDRVLCRRRGGGAGGERAVSSAGQQPALLSPSKRSPGLRMPADDSRHTQKHGKSDPVGTEARFDRKRHHGSTALGCHKIYRGFIVDITVNHNYEVGIKITMTRKSTK